MNPKSPKSSQDTQDTKAFRRILVRNIAFPLGLGLLSSIIFVFLIFQQVNQSREVIHADQIIGLANHLQKLVIDSETGIRGYVITNNEKFLEPYNNAIRDYPLDVRKLQALVASDPVQSARVSEISRVYSQWRQYAEIVISIVEQGQGGAAFVRQGDGKALMDQIRGVFADILQNEEFVRDEKVLSAQRTARTVVFIVIGLNLIFGIFLAVIGRRQLVSLSKTFEASMKRQLEQNEVLRQDQWQKEGLAGLSDIMVGEQKMTGLSDGILSYLGRFAGVKVGTLYVVNSARKLVRTGAYGLDLMESEKNKILEFGEGLIGQAAKENSDFDLEFSDDRELHITSSLMKIQPRFIKIIPILSDGAVIAVIELGFAEIPSKEVLEFLSSARDFIGTSMKSAKYREQLETLLREVQSQAEELQAQQEELKVNNEELEEQTQMLKDAQARLESQAAELEQTNAQLEEQSQALEVQTQELSEKNRDLTSAKSDLEMKADELERSSQYKSEFLANMSHELRTPLNSSLILAKLLADNKDRNLTPQQIEFANQILRSGNDLLVLINDILDLAKVEAGKLDLSPEEFSLRMLVGDLERMFQPLAKQKHLEFKTRIAPDVPKDMNSDRLRVEQILRNLLSNAIKFTEEGSVTLEVNSHPQGLSFTVIDSGIGIAKTQQDVIFEAFRQADGTTNRRYGGTGLGLAISRDLAKMLGGAIAVESEVGRGSAFSLVLPLRYTQLREVHGSPQASSPQKQEVIPQNHEQQTFIPDDRGRIEKNEGVILIIEDDEDFAKDLRNLAHQLNFKCVITDSAAEGIELAQELKPDAVCLDIQLPAHEGTMVKDALKQNPETRRIPIHILSKQDFAENALKPVKRDELQSAFAQMQERMNENVKSLLIVEDDHIQRQAIIDLISNETMNIVAVGVGREAIEALQARNFDCVVMDLNLPDMSGFDLLEGIAEQTQIPSVIVYTGRDLSSDEEARLKRYSQSVIVKGARSPERLLDEVRLFLHQVESKLAPSRKKSNVSLRNREKVLEKKHILIVDDDMRNIFALTAALEQKGARVSMCRNGEEALRKLDESGVPDIVLMDIMMPVMDGLEATRRIRLMPNMQKLPIIALTAKAMKDDREQCFEAGANDYLSKPVDLDKLVSLIRVWVTQKQELRNDGTGALQS